MAHAPPDFQPVGIMVYGSASFMTVPWETIIKVYRKELDKKSFDKLVDSANDFFRFLALNNSLFSESVKENAMARMCYCVMEHIRKTIDTRVEEEITKNGFISDEGVKDVVNSVQKKCIHSGSKAPSWIAPGNLSKTALSKCIGRRWAV